MPHLYFTERDGECLRAVYFLSSTGSPVGPARLARALSVSRVTAMHAMRRLAALGFGEYVAGEGLVLSKDGLAQVEEAIWRHHVVEKLLSQSVDMPCGDACSESSRIQFGLSDEFVMAAFEKMGRPENCDCGCAISPPFDSGSLGGCNWCKLYLDPEGPGNGGGRGKKRRGRGGGK